MLTPRQQACYTSVINTYGGQTVTVRVLLSSKLIDRGLILSLVGISRADYPDEQTYLDQPIQIPDSH